MLKIIMNEKKKSYFKEILSKRALMNINKPKKLFCLNSKNENNNEDRYLNDVIKFVFTRS